MINTSLIDYTKCHEYARSLCGSCGIPECDVADIASDAYLLSIRRSWRMGDESENPEAVARRLMYTSVVNVINRRNKHTIRMLSDAESLYKSNSDDGSPSDDEVVEERFTANDADSTEDRLCEYLDWQNPFWLRLFVTERRKLRGSCRKTVSLLLQDSRLPVARARLGVSRPTFSWIVRKLCERFELCYRALRVWRRKS